MSPEKEKGTMKLTRQHFELIANVLAAADIPGTSREQLAIRFMYEFAKTNSNFDNVRFLKACGV